jgi:hypothetical protein
MSKAQKQEKEGKPYELKPDEFAVYYDGDPLTVKTTQLKFKKLKDTIKVELTLEIESDSEKIVLNNPLTEENYAVFKEEIDNFVGNTVNKIPHFVVEIRGEYVAFKSGSGEIVMITKGKKEHGEAYYLASQ